MREIKFRAWDKVNTAFMPSEGFAIHDGDVMGLRYGNEMDDVLNGEVELTQYTGLKNYAGAEIYDGDFMHDMDDDYYMLVHYEDGQYMCGDNLLSDCLGCDVVSNKFESPELLEGAE